MCGRYIVASDQDKIEKVFRAKATKGIKADYNIGIGDYAPVITGNNPLEIQMFRFGLTPFWAKKKMSLYNARAEGVGNQENDPNYSGGKGIINMPSFRKPIRSQRCLVIADAFIEGTTKGGLTEPYLVYLENRAPFAFAGIWDTWIDPATKEVINGFAIITVPPNELLLALPHHRCPVILSPKDEDKWLKEDAPLNSITPLLSIPLADNMNAYRIDPVKIRNRQYHERDIIEAKGEVVKKIISHPEQKPNVPHKLRFYKPGEEKATLEERLKKKE